MTGKISDNLGRSSGLIKAVSAGRTGTVDWCTTAKTSPFTAVSGNGYMINTCGGAKTVTLPSSPSAGDIVSVADYKSTWALACKAVTVARGGSKINGGCNCVTLSTKGQSVTMVYIDGTQGWKSVQDSTSDVTGLAAYTTATGGTISTSGDYKIHTFTGDGCFAVTAGLCASVSYMVVAGGGGGGGDHSGGGGAGGYREGKKSTDPYSASPLAATPCSALTVTTQTYPISVGGGGAGGSGQAPSSPNAPQGSIGIAGDNSVFSSITSAGGGGGAKEPVSPYSGQNSGAGTAV